MIKDIKNSKGNSGFTLLELLIVISIIAILSVALVIVLNPAEALRKARDAQRISDLSTIKTALGIMLTATTTPTLDNLYAAANTATICTTSTTGTLGTTGPRIRYSSASTPTLGGSLVAGSDSAFTPWVTAAGTAAASAGKVDGSGWIPAPLSGLTGGSPLSNYPVDPVNTVSSTATSSDLVYRYACQNASSGGKPGYIFEIDAQLESDAYTITEDKRANDGGDNPYYYETGTSLKLLPTGQVF